MEGGRDSSAKLAFGLLASVCLAMTACGCRIQDDGPARASAPSAQWPSAPPASATRGPGWLGGTEPLSGKLRSGVSVYHRAPAAALRAGDVVEVELRVEGVVQEGTTLRLDPIAGARHEAPDAPSAWRLPVGQASEFRVRIVVPAGLSYLNATSVQGGRSSVQAIALKAPGTNPATTAAPRAETTVDAAGEPIVRMQAAPGR